VRIGYLDCVGGISGDMFVGALLSAGWPERALRDAIAWLAPEIAELRVERRMHHALSGLGIVVVPGDHPPEQGHGHGHDRAQEPGHHGAGPHFRGLPEVSACLRSSPLDERVRTRALAVFQRLAEAEAQAHGQPIERVHFHEVGAVDAMVDIVGVCQGLQDLGIERLHVSPLPVGQGVIEGSHGCLPLPAPATAYLLRGAPIRWTGTEGERTTPTGAALVSALGTWDPPPAIDLEAVGVGAGSRSLADVPNLARLFIGRPLAATGASSAARWPGGAPEWGWDARAEGCPGQWGEVVRLEALLDDATAEQIADCAERLRSAGALEVFCTPAQMKKGRPGTLLTAIGRPADEEALQGVIFAASPTLGVRRGRQWRRELERRAGKVATRFGAVDVKWARRAGGWRGKPEFESCRAVAEGAGVSWMDVWTAALAAAEGERLRQDAHDEP